ncbi:MAG: glycosyltransferase [bacterium]
MRILLWHVHGSWTTAFVQGAHDYVLPVLPERGADGLGRAETWEWPASAVERTPAELAGEALDLVVLQRPEELELVTRWLGRKPGVDVPAVYLEHNAPEPHPVHSRHAMADRSDIPVVHVTHFNRLFWDSGRAPTFVVEHGVVDPGERYTGELARAAVVINEPLRRGRMVGTDLLDRFDATVPVDVFGMQARLLPARPGRRTFDDLPDQEALYTEIARRRLYLHPVRWTSLGLALIEAMLLGLPVVAVAATEVVEAVSGDAGVISTDVDRLIAAAERFSADPDAARSAGRAARRAALERYGLGRFLADWDVVLDSVAR